MPLIGNPTKTLEFVFAAADQLGADVPKKVRDRHRDLAKLVDQANNLDLHGDLPGVVVAAIEAGRDPFTDPAVLAESVRAQLSNNPNQRNSFAAALSDRASTFLTEHAADIWSGFTTPFDAAAAALRAALDRLGDTPLEDTHRVLARGGDAADVWAAAKRAEATIGKIRNMWKILGAATPVFPDEHPRTRLLVIADIPAEQWIDNQPAGSDLGPWDALRVGYRLALATPDSYRKRIAEITQLRDDRAAAARNRNRRAVFGRKVAS